MAKRNYQRLFLVTVLGEESILLDHINTALKIEQDCRLAEEETFTTVYHLGLTPTHIQIKLAIINKHGHLS